MKKMIKNIKHIAASIATSYKSAMNFYGEALLRGSGYGMA